MNSSVACIGCVDTQTNRLQQTYLQTEVQVKTVTSVFLNNWVPVLTELPTATTVPPGWMSTLSASYLVCCSNMMLPFTTSTICRKQVHNVNITG